MKKTNWIHADVSGNIINMYYINPTARILKDGESLQTIKR